MFHVSVLSAEKMIFEGSVSMLVATTVSGEVGILPHHRHMVAELAEGRLTLTKEDKSEETLFVAGGFLEVSNNQATVLADTVENVHEIEVAQAAQARKVAEEALKNVKNETQKEHLLAEIHLQSARERLAGIAQYSKK